MIEQTGKFVLDCINLCCVLTTCERKEADESYRVQKQEECMENRKLGICIKWKQIAEDKKRDLSPLT